MAVFRPATVSSDQPSRLPTVAPVLVEGSTVHALPRNSSLTSGGGKCFQDMSLVGGVPYVRLPSLNWRLGVPDCSSRCQIRQDRG
jgi:hypothetical protein